MWTKWTAIVANTDYDRFDNTESPFTSTNTEQERILIATTCPPWIQDFSYDFDGISLRIVGIRRYKDFLKHVDNTIVYFYILCVMVIILASFVICLSLIVSEMTD